MFSGVVLRGAHKNSGDKLRVFQFIGGSVTPVGVRVIRHSNMQRAVILIYVRQVNRLAGQ
jgi:hypothetical protein